MGCAHIERLVGFDPVGLNAELHGHGSQSVPRITGILRACPLERP
jgi:hypothetical protein